MSLYAAQTAKIVLVGSVGVLGLLSGIDNILDYRTPILGAAGNREFLIGARR